MRTVFLAFAFACAFTAQASYELLLVADKGNGAAGTSRIHRIDGTSGAYLGSFGSNILTGAIGVTVDSALGLAYVTEGDSGPAHIFDYSTGVYYGQRSSTFYDRYPVKLGSNLYATQGFGLYKLPLNGGAQTSLNLPNGGSALWLAQTSSTKAIVYSYLTNTTGNLYEFNSTNESFVSLGAVNLSFGISNFAAANFLPSYQGGGPAIIAGSGVLGDLHVFRLTGSNAFSSASTFSSNSLNNCLGVANAHGGFYATGKLASNGALGGVTFFTNYGAEKQTYSYGNLYDPRGIASVIAPEPGTMLAIGAGLVAMLKRRKKA